MASGVCTATILFVLGVTGLMKLVYKLIPLLVIGGIQLAQGISFTITPLNGPQLWLKSDMPPVLPPTYGAQPGQKKKKRRLEPDFS
ncbi:hypothetical protein LguiA_033256 [Lonicera macranthoides]